MDELVKRVLTVSASLAPNDGASFILHARTIATDKFTVAFHIRLLHISWKSGQPLVVGQYGVRIDMKEIVVPNAD